MLSRIPLLFSPSMSTGDSDEEAGDSVPANRSREPADRSRDAVDGRARDRSSSLRPALFQPPSNHHPVEAINQLAKSVSTPHIPGGAVQNGNEEYVSTPTSKSS